MRERDFQTPGRSLVYAANGMVSTSHPLASAIALDALKEGGNAVDAALAAGFALPLLEPMMTSLGGDMFGLYAPPGAGEAEVLAINGSGAAPAGLDVAPLRAAGAERMAFADPRAATLPGCVAGLTALAKAAARFDLDRLTRPARAYARAGVPVAPRTASDWARFAGQLQGPGARHHLRPDGRAPQAGDLYAAPGLAEALEAIAAKGPAGFYEGPIAEDMAATLALLGGPHRAADFAGVSAERARPLSAEAFGPDHRLTTTPPNSQGAVAHLIMAILAQAPARLLSADPFGPERLHWESEAVKLAYGARDRLLGEPSPEMDAAIAKLLAPETAAGLAAEIAPDRAAPLDAAAARAAARYRGAPHEDTVVLSAVDRDGGACTLITSLFNAFGTGVASERYGVLMHSRGAGFTLKPDHPNSARPGARPLHTMMPSLLFEKGRLRMAFGVMGGQYQAAGQAWLLGSRLRYGLDLQTAIDGPRAFPERAADAPDAAPTERLRTERGVDDATRAALRAFGHPVRESLLPLGGAQAIEIDWERGALIGAADPRKDGCALGW